MKISKSKQQLARIISENGGWRDGADWAAQDQNAAVTFFVDEPWRCGTVWECGNFEAVGGFGVTEKSLKNWHQTILSRAEYFHLYPAPDADGWTEWKGGECPVDDSTYVDVKLANGCEYKKQFMLMGSWSHDNGEFNILAYRLHKPEIAPAAQEPKPVPEPEAKPSIEQLTADYRNAKDYAGRKQEEADAAKADAEAKLAALVAAGKAIGLVLSVAGAEPELVITDWRDLKAGDWVWAEEEGSRVARGEYEVLEVETPGYDGKRTIRIRGGEGGQFWINYENGWRFIRRS